MKAIGIRRFGEPGELQSLEIRKPEPGPGQIVVKVLACGLNPVDYKVRKGMLPLGFAFPLVPGYDISGTVEEVGPGVDAFAPGDEVYYSPELLPPGGCAEYNVTEADIVALKPVGLTHLEAAAVPLAGCTAWQGLFDRAGVEPGDVVLVHGGAGGVGSLAVQLAAWAGAEVLATAGADNLEYVEDLGASLVVDHAEENFVEAVLEATQGRGVDCVLDCIGGETLLRSFQVLADGASVVTMVPENLGALPLEGLAQAYFKNADVHFLFMRRRRETLDDLARLLERGYIEPRLEEVIAFDAAHLAEAHRRLETGHGRGKLVVRVADA